MDKNPLPITVDLVTALQPPLLLSVAAECLAGALLTGYSLASYQPWLLAAAAALIFGAGAAHGAYFDRHLAEEPAPEARASARQVDPEWLWRWGLAAVAAAVLLALLAGRREALAAVAVATVVLLHASVTRGVWGLGFLTTGLAHAGVFLMGLSADEHGIARHAAAALPVLAYAVGWAVLRASRQPGAPPSTPFVALLHLLAGVALLIYQTSAQVYYPLDAVVFMLPLLPLVLPRLVRVMADPRRPAAVEAVQYTFVGLTLLEASLAAGYAGLAAGLVVTAVGLGVFLALRRWPVRLVTWPR
jgi:4-hydroxybenzoate polyprenyltransferase